MQLFVTHYAHQMLSQPDLTGKLHSLTKFCMNLFDVDRTRIQTSIRKKPKNEAPPNT